MPEKLRIRVINTQNLEQTQTEPPKPKVVVEYHWGRIVSALCLLAVLSAGLIWGVAHFFSQSDEKHRADLPTEPPTAVVATAPAVSSPIKSEKPLESTVARESAGAVDVKPLSSQPQSVTEKPLDNTVDGPKSPVDRIDKPAKSTVSILSGSIKRAQLTSGVKDDAPIDIIGQTIPMNDKGLIRVYLFMETAGLKGKVLHHDWYWKGKRIAHARIPIKRREEIAASSKFIDRIMMGPWEVKIVDESNRILATVDFQVQ